MTDGYTPQNMDAWRFDRVPDSPKYAQTVFDRLMPLPDSAGDDQWDWIDMRCRPMGVPRKEDRKTYIHQGYAEALWDFKNRDLVLESAPNDKGAVLYRRDMDTDQGELLDTWHAIASIADEYGVPRSERNQRFERLFLRECRRLACPDGRPLRLIHGIRFTNRAYWVDDHGDGSQTLNRAEAGDPILDMPFELNLDSEFTDREARRAREIMQGVCADPDSLYNLLLLPAAPFLQKYKHLTFALAGDGGNGKGVFFSAFTRYNDQTARLACTVDAEKLAGGSRLSGTSLEQEPAKLIGKLWAFDEDANGLDQHQTERLKRLSTGDRIDSRRLGRDVVSFNPRATLCIATNLDFVTGMDASMRRRFAFVRMRDHRDPDEIGMRVFRRYCATIGAAGFIMASCEHWMANPDGRARIVQLNRPENMTDAELWVAGQIVETGYASSADNPYMRASDGVAIGRLKTKMGLVSVRRGRGEPFVLAVGSSKEARARFEPFRAYAAEMLRGEGHVAPPEPLDPAPATRDPHEYGFGCDYVDAGPDKVARNWKRRTEDPDTDTTLPPQYAEAWACVPAPGYAVLDFDMSKTPDGRDGWSIVSTEVGRYDSLAFPATFLVRTPSGGVHAYYRLPEGVTLKNAVHEQDIPLDIRTARKGYVIAPGSLTSGGRYEIADARPVAEISGTLLGWLAEHGYVDGMGADADDAQVDADTGEILDRMGFARAATPPAARPDGVNRGATMRLNPPAQTPGATHMPLVEWTYGLCRRAAEQGFEQGEVDTLVERMRAMARPGHDPKDTALIIRTALDKAGLATTVPLR
ncbi:bifunctional DNA primase/polymerase [Bifidobacterium castoris]|uniref:Bifunctional DNA primase/polymerase, N-terminal n=1 Tax=Bifidobacterium castoris TaxID=2306972 RepID=A0A430FAH8_9BIFI|nr:bifunctional DNA primase/polymerase [Bifidobacterium castoris]RSX49850.1 Bifunctional DNA primase/polymerase, N-terminal [Bifidobacterium castoris]